MRKCTNFAPRSSTFRIASVKFIYVASEGESFEKLSFFDCTGYFRALLGNFFSFFAIPESLQRGWREKRSEE